MNRLLLLGLSLLTALPMLATGDAESPIVATADTSRVIDLDEVVIVKETFSLRNQPVSSTIIDGRRMEQLGVRDLRDVSQYVPSFVMPNYGSRYTSSMYVRGIGSRVNSPAVGVYKDNLPVLNKSMFNAYTYDLERVDVMRGPQGTLYGQNTEGGLVRMYSLAPMKHQGTHVRLGLGTDFYRKAEFSHYAKPCDQLAWSVAAFYDGQNGFLKNQATGERADKMDEAGGKARLQWKPSERLLVDVLADYQYVSQNGFAYGQVDSLSDKTADPATNRQGNYSRHMLTTGATLSYRTDWGELAYAASWQYLNDDMLMDIDYRPQDYLHMEQAQLQNALTQELSLRSRNDGRWHWTTGAFQSYQALKTNAPVYFDPAMNTYLSQVIEDYAYTGMLNAMAKRMGMDAAKAMIDRAGGCHIALDMETIPGRFRTPTHNFGLFHESSIDLTDRLTATLGLRYDLSQTSIDYMTAGAMHLDENVMGTQLKVNISSLLEHQESAGFEQWLPKVGLRYRVGNGSNVYAVVQKGYRAGGFNIQMFSDIIQSEFMSLAQNARTDLDVAHDETFYRNIRETIAYKPEESWNYEAGTHLNLFDGRLHADLAAYYMQIRNQQLSVMATTYGFGRMMVNAGKSYSCGVEATLRGSAFDNHLSWGASYAYTHAVFKRYETEQAGDCEGNFVPFVPQNTIAAYADYRFDLGLGSLRAVTIGANLSAQGKTYWDEANLYAQDLYGLLGAHADADLGRFTVSLWGRNLTDTRYNTFVVNSSIGSGNTANFAQRGQPLQMGVDLRMNL